MSDILTTIDRRGVATVTLNRPERHNAFDDQLLGELRTALEVFGEDRQVKIVVLAAVGKSFSAGADLGWMRRMALATEEENYQDALVMAEFFAELATCAKPTIAAVQGSAFGGGVGLVAACDMALAAESARFAISEVKVGIIPVVISPYLARSLGARTTRRLALTGESFSARNAQAMGLVDVVAEADRLQEAVEQCCGQLLKNGPAAMAAVKERICAWHKPNLLAVARETARTIAEIRVSAEGREGVAAFLEKRQPAWVTD